jgi:F-type H+-transporting ATPase subunit b
MSARFVAGTGAALLVLLAPVLARANEVEAVEHGAEGIPFLKLLLHAFNLALLLGLLGFLLRGRIRDALADRSVRIKREMDEINDLRKVAQERYTEIEARLQGYDKKLGELKADAEQEAAAEAKEIAARAERDALQIQKAAERTIRDETIRARQALRHDAVELAVKLAEEQLKQQITEEDQRRFASEFLDTVQSNGNGVHKPGSKGVDHG